MLHKYHVRYISEIAPGFMPLASHNEIALSSSRRILTSQGHPEMTSDISKLLAEGDDGTYKQPKDTRTMPDGVLVHDISTNHDGSETWIHIMRWAN